MKNDLTAYYSEHHADTVIATGERDFTINVPASECGPVPTVEPTDAPSCIFNPVAYVKIRENGQDTLFPEVGNDAEEWSTTNDKRLKKYGDEVFYRAPFDEDGQLPVSYTHLDVYKRQGDGRPMRSPGHRPGPRR